MAYIVGNRKQLSFLPPKIDDYVGKEDPVRVYDAFVDSIDLHEYGNNHRPVPSRSANL